ncbi:hypothetical protein GCM10023188_26180 [Pontibacter saemangeumensis]|uniref:Uncharacterized protein n=1 Tax=Pontibacter saemangeumensis TaxID=1084525 RepID=A0ABP8LSU3_9BACT
MRRFTNIETIAAYGRLLEFSSNKRYGVIENNFSNSVIDNIALQFNQEIKKKEGLDIIELEDNEMIIKYEDIVDDLLTKFTYKNIIKDETDEGQLLKSSYEIPSDYLKDKRVGVAAYLKENIKPWSVSMPNLVAFCKTAHAASASNWGEDYPQEIFLTSEAILKGRKRMIFAHVGKANPEMRQRTNIDWEIRSICFFSSPAYSSLIDSPTMIFLKILRDYGLDIKINDITKRFIYKLSLPKTFSTNDLVIDVQNRKEGAFKTVMHMMQTYLGFYISCGYVLKDQALLKDSLAGRI